MGLIYEDLENEADEELRACCDYSCYDEENKEDPDESKRIKKYWKGVNYHNVFMINVKTTQELISRVEILENENKVFRTEIDD